MTATTIILVGLLLCILFAVLHLIAIAQRIEKGIASVVRILDARKEELEELEVLEIELKGIHKLLALSGADKEDIKRMEEIEEKIARIEDRAAASTAIARSLHGVDPSTRIFLPLVEPTPPQVRTNPLRFASGIIASPEASPCASNRNSPSLPLEVL